MKLSIDDSSNKKRVCLRCGIIINKTTDSGWEKFVDTNTTQPICVFCHEKELKQECWKCVPMTEND